VNSEELNTQRGILLGRIIKKCYDTTSSRSAKGHSCDYRKAIEAIQQMIEAHVDKRNSLKKK
jgi:hypothetical protein